MSGLGYAAVLALLVALFVVARSVTPATDKQGQSFNGVNSALAQPYLEPSSLRVATYNIQTGKSLTGERDISRAADVLKQVDIAAVQEVYGAGWLNKIGIGEPQTLRLAKAGDFSHLFAATRIRWWREQRGNTTLSKLPIKSWRIQMLPDQSRKSPRNMTVSEFIWQGQPAVFINTHLHTGRGREAQLKAVLNEFMRHPRVILAGDFNSKISDPTLARVLQDNTVTDAIKQANLTQAGEHRIDWILTRGFEVIGGREQATGVSDHPYYEVVLQ